jgi:glycosyltransferase involved in cell wall biosynthesis
MSTQQPSLGVVMLLGWPGLGGTQSQALRLSTELRSLGVNSFVLTWRHGDSSRHETINGVGVYQVGCRASGSRRALAFLGGAFLWMLRHRRSFQVIHAHNLPTALTAALLRPLLRRPVIVKLPNPLTVEEFSHRRFGLLRWVILRRCVTRFVALNADIETRLKDKGVPAERILRIPNGVEPSNGLRPGDITSTRLALRLAPGSRTVIYLGRLIPDKGIAWLLEVWKDVLREAETCHLLVVGDGPDGPPLRALAHRLGVKEAVSFLGYQENVDRILSIADILVLPSLSEGMSNALLEGMSHGLAVVATDVPGNRAVIEHGRDGVLVAYGDRPALREALLNLLGDSNLRVRLGRAARQKSESAFSIRAVAKTYCTVYWDLIGGRAPQQFPTHRPPTTTSVSST